MGAVRRLKWFTAVNRRKYTAVTALLVFVSGCSLIQHSQLSYSAGENRQVEGTFSNYRDTYSLQVQGLTLLSYWGRTGTAVTQDIYSDIKKGDVSWLKTPEDFFRRLERERPQTRCRKTVRMGGNSCRRILDGDKWLCLDEDVILKPPHCVVYSFGLSSEITFDNMIAKYGCDVYMMDPTLPPGTYSWLHGKQKFFPIGLSDTSVIYQINLTTYADWQGMINMTVTSFDNVHKMIGHSGAVHYLKMDIEGNEWKSVGYMMEHDLLKGTQQIMVELHSGTFPTMPMDEAVLHFREKWLFLEQLEDHGFLRVRYDPTLSIESIYNIPGTNRTMQICGEMFLIRRNRENLL
uniref:Methyltransferase-like protein 24 isoform X1 n=2 Tax=Hirondellea gigas TaxID=1518452 RepID=A0A6A7G4H7_9CRUS